MDKNRKVIWITVAIVGFILIASIISMVVLSMKNASLKEGKVRVVIYQYYTDLADKKKEPVIYKSFVFTKDLEYDEVIYALHSDGEHDYNHVVIKDGKIKVTQADCFEGRCQYMVIDLNNQSLSILNPNTTTIECKPHGLRITLEEIE